MVLSQPLHRRNICRWFQPLHRRNEVFEKWRPSPPGTAFVHVPNFDQNRNFFQSRPLHRRSIHAEFKPLHRLNEVSKMAERLLHGRFCSLSRLWFKIEILSIPAEPP
ncbi:hypothetical protein TNCV_2051381 [Trichonephila clavipes]|nr:hypothetical protein TNCV_2051381 [Trichonephila clavipes]